MKILKLSVFTGKCNTHLYGYETNHMRAHWSLLWAVVLSFLHHQDISWLQWTPTNITDCLYRWFVDYLPAGATNCKWIQNVNVSVNVSRWIMLMQISCLLGLWFIISVLSLSAEFCNMLLLHVMNFITTFARSLYLLEQYNS